MEISKARRASLAIAERHNIGIEEAIDRMKKQSVFLIASAEIMRSVSMQIAFLTTVNVSSRVFCGGVICQIPVDIPNLLRLGSGSFKSLVHSYGGLVQKNQPLKNDIKILFGIECYDGNCIESVSSGWRGGVNFFGKERVVMKENNHHVSLGPVLAASMAVFYAFCKAFRLIDNLIEMNTGASLWNLNSGKLWHKDEHDGPDLPRLPRNVWILGLGHLGQAYMWTLGLMNFKIPKKATFLIQDNDVVGEENIGSQILCITEDIGFPKTRPCYRFLELLGYKTQIIEKPYVTGDSDQKWMEAYKFLLNGVDNIDARKGISSRYVNIYLDGGTNGKLPLFDSFTLKNVFETGLDYNHLWGGEGSGSGILHKNLYERYQKKNGCGVLTNIGISTPFIGSFGAAVLVSELIRALNKGKKYSVVTMQLRDLDSLTAIEVGSYDNSLLRYSI